MTGRRDRRSPNPEAVAWTGLPRRAVALLAMTKRRTGTDAQADSEMDWGN